MASSDFAPSRRLDSRIRGRDFMDSIAGFTYFDCGSSRARSCLMNILDENNFRNLKALRAQSSSSGASEFTEYLRPPMISRSCDSRIWKGVRNASRIVLVYEVVFIKAKWSGGG